MLILKIPYFNSQMDFCHQRLEHLSTELIPKELLLKSLCVVDHQQLSFDLYSQKFWSPGPLLIQFPFQISQKGSLHRLGRQEVAIAHATLEMPISLCFQL